MQDEMIREKYIDIKDKFLFIKSELSDLDDLYIDLIGSLKSGLLVDDNIVFSSDFSYLHDSNSVLISEIDKDLIPMFNNNI